MYCQSSFKSLAGVLLVSNLFSFTVTTPLQGLTDKNGLNVDPLLGVLLGIGSKGTTYHAITSTPSTTTKKPNYSSTSTTRKPNQPANQTCPLVDLEVIVSVVIQSKFAIQREGKRVSFSDAFFFRFHIGCDSSMTADQCMGKICNASCQQSCGDSLAQIRICVDIILQLEVIVNLLNEEESLLGIQLTTLNDLLELN